VAVVAEVGDVAINPIELRADVIIERLADLAAAFCGEKLYSRRFKALVTKKPTSATTTGVNARTPR